MSFGKVKLDPADRLFSLYVRWRANWTCERCGARHEVGSQGLHCSHFHGRRKESVRFDPENASAHCHGCHSYFTSHPEAHRAWKLEQLGQEAYDRLMIRANTSQKKDRKLAKIYWQARLREEFPEALN